MTKSINTDPLAPCPECKFVRYRPDSEYHDYGCSVGQAQREAAETARAKFHEKLSATAKGATVK